MAGVDEMGAWSLTFAHIIKMVIKPMLMQCILTWLSENGIVGGEAEKKHNI